MPKNKITDPVEAIVAKGLRDNGIVFLHENDIAKARRDGSRCLDFFLPSYGTWIECKQFYTDRTNDQLSKFDDVILLQGKKAAGAFVEMISKEKSKAGTLTR